MACMWIVPTMHTCDQYVPVYACVRACVRGWVGGWVVACIINSDFCVIVFILISLAYGWKSDHSYWDRSAVSDSCRTRKYSVNLLD